MPAPFDARLAALRADMAAAGIDLFLADQAELIAWLTGYMGSETMYRACLVPTAGDPWIVLRALDAAPCEAVSWVADLETYPDTADALAEVVRTIRARGHGTAAIGIDDMSYAMTAARRDRLAVALPEARWIARTGLGDRIRAVKDETEIAFLRRAAAIADRTVAAVHAEAAPGITSRKAAAIAAATYLLEGADDGQVGRIAAGRGGTGFLHAELDDTPLQPGDVLHVEVVPRVRHYSARLMRPIVIGPPSPGQATLAARLIALQDAQIAAMTGGTPAREADAVLRAAMLAEGLRDDYTNATGYMLGLYGRTPRSSDFSHAILPTAEWRLDSGMVFHMYTSARGLAFSETVLVTGTGGERLTRSPRELLATPA